MMQNKFDSIGWLVSGFRFSWRKSVAVECISTFLILCIWSSVHTTADYWSFIYWKIKFVWLKQQSLAHITPSNTPCVNEEATFWIKLYGYLRILIFCSIFCPTHITNSRIEDINKVYLSSSASSATKENQGNSKLTGVSNERPLLEPDIQENQPPPIFVRRSWNSFFEWWWWWNLIVIFKKILFLFLFKERPSPAVWPNGEIICSMLDYLRQWKCLVITRTPLPLKAATTLSTGWDYTKGLRYSSQGSLQFNLWYQYYVY